MEDSIEECKIERFEQNTISKSSFVEPSYFLPEALESINFLRREEPNKEIESTVDGDKENKRMDVPQEAHICPKSVVGLLFGSCGGIVLVKLGKEVEVEVTKHTIDVKPHIG